MRITRKPDGNIEYAYDDNQPELALALRDGGHLRVVNDRVMNPLGLQMSVWDDGHVAIEAWPVDCLTMYATLRDDVAKALAHSVVAKFAPVLARPDADHRGALEEALRIIGSIADPAASARLNAGVKRIVPVSEEGRMIVLKRVDEVDAALAEAAADEGLPTLADATNVVVNEAPPEAVEKIAKGE